MEILNKKFIIYIVDDEPSIGLAICQTLAELPCDAVAFTRAEECLSAIRKKKCDLLIADLNMPGLDGLGLLSAVKKILPWVPVLLITGYGEISAAVKAIKAGAFDFIEKPLDQASFLSVVRAALEQNPSGEWAERQALTKAEHRVLQLVMDGKSNKEIAYILGCSTRTVENHRYRLMRKLKVESTASLVKVAITMGLAGAYSKV
jgi:FixJ family two-component response regulator